MDAPRPLAGRYAFAKRFRGTQRTIIWAARERAIGRDVVASVLPPARAEALKPLVGLSHDHLALLLDVIDKPAREEIPGDDAVADDAKVVVAAHIHGRSLQERLDTSPISVEDAVQWIVHTADALASLHDRGGVHGAISPRAIVVTRFDHGTVPILTHLVVPPSGSYCSPERVTGGGPSPGDDLWALAATLYFSLARRAPFHGTSRTELARAIVRAAPETIDAVDQDLYDIVRQGLAASPANRFENAAKFRDALERWLKEADRASLGEFLPVSTVPGNADPTPDVGDLSLVAALARPDSPESQAPFIVHRLTDKDPADRDSGLPALAESSFAVTEPPVRQVSPPDIGHLLTTPPKREQQGSPLKFGIALAVIAAISAGVGMLGAKLRASAKHGSEGATAVATVPPDVPQATVVARGTAPEPGSATETASSAAPGSAPNDSARPVELASAPLPTSEAPPQNASECAARVLPENTIGDQPDVGFLCSETDLWTTARHWNLYVARHGQGQGMVQWAHLGRFDLAAIGVLVHRCCPGAAVTAATPKGVCDTLNESISALGDKPTPDAVDHYAADVDCIVNRQVRYPTEWWDRVGPKDARAAFDQFMTSLR